MNQEIRNRLRNVVTQCRKLLEDSVTQDLEGKFGIFARNGQVTADPNAPMTHLTEEERGARRDILDHLEHIKARGFKSKDALDQLIREIAFTHLNRFCAYKMMEAREVYVGGQKFREAVSRGVDSNGVKFYLADHPEDLRLFNTGHQDIAYRRYLDWLGGLLSEEIGVLFNPNDPANRLYPRQSTLDEVLNLLNGGGIKPDDTELRGQWPSIWSSDETIGWVYQYFTPKELRDQARKESTVPRSSYELAFRNQFFTPRYVVEFLVDNTLGRIWFEMRKGQTKLADNCKYLVRRSNEIFLHEKQEAPTDANQSRDNLSQDELLKLPFYVPHRAKKDPRELKILDPAAGSGHFLLYCFDLLSTIYEEAYTDAHLGPSLQKEYERLDDLRRDVPRLILEQNLYGIDIDLRASQIAAFALWLRSQKAFQELGLKKDRPKITRSNLVCAEPMPGEAELRSDFVKQLEPKLLGQIVEAVFDKMKLAGEAGSLLNIAEEIRDKIAAAKQQWIRETTHAIDRKGHPLLFTQFMMDRLSGKAEQSALFDLSDISDAQFFEEAEAKVVEALRRYAEQTQSLQRRLFTDDAVRGFAFAEISHLRFDVVLMNPPFGDAPHSVRPYLNEKFPNWGNDIYVAFGSRALSMVGDSGAVGAITSRLGFFLSSFASWREEEILRKSTVACFADLGYGVLDEALVEVAAWALVVPKRPKESVFLRLLGVKEKEEWLLPSVQSLGKKDQRTTFGYLVDQSTFGCVDGSPFCYWVSDTLRKRLQRFSRLNEVGGDARQGMSTADDERYLRLAWEVSPDEVGGKKRWVLFAKGGEYSPYYDDIHLVVDWNQGTSTLVGSGAFLRNQRFYLKPGLTYSQRSTSAFNPKLFPADCIFSTGGHGVFMDVQSKGLFFLGVLSSRVANLQVEMAVGSGDDAHSGSAARNYLNGMVNAIRCPQDSATVVKTIGDATKCLVDLSREKGREDETTRLFVAPPVFIHRSNSITATQEALYRHDEGVDLKMIESFAKLDEAIFNAYSLKDRERAEIDTLCGSLVSELPDGGSPSDDEVGSCFKPDIAEVIERAQAKLGSARFISKKAYVSSRRLELAARLLNVHPRKIVERRREVGVLPPDFLAETVPSIIQYIVGVLFGRWDIRYATGERSLPPLPAPFEPFPSCAPGMLIDQSGFPARTSPKDYPVRVEMSGILVDDVDNPDEIVRRVQAVIELFWHGQGESIEKEMCERLDTKDLREYFRRPGNGGFWDDHLTHYSKSRRSAPIYWLLQSSKRNYALWFYYHRLDKDFLFKALVNNVEPKVRLETSRLATLRSQIASAGKEAKKLAKQAEQQEDLLSELKDFEDRLRKVANLNLIPDLNDGVLLNIAPLHELVPWKEAESYWEELLQGKYEWSSIGKQIKQLQQKGLLR